MTPAELSLSRPVPPSDGEVRLDALFRPFVRRWRLVALCVLATCAAAAAAILIPRRVYRAQLIVASVPNVKSASLAGGLSALMGGAAGGGVQSTPYFITRLLMMPGVLRDVARSSAPDGRGTVIERVTELPASRITPTVADRAMRAILTTDVDKQTGLVTFAVTHRDSALARQIAERVLAGASRTYVRVLRSQASDQRESGEAQVDSARRQLRAVESRLQDFQTSHRVYMPYSPAAVERQRIDRDLATAQTAYSDAVNDRQSAIARELAETPALVVVDPLPPELAPEPRQGVLKLLLAAAAGVMLAGVIMLLRGDFAAPAAGGAGAARSLAA